MPAASAIKVMVVDDQASMRAMIRRALIDLGFKDVRDAAGPVEALNAIRSDRVHLVISDYNMPDMDGLAFLKDVRADPVIGKTVFIMLTGSSDREIVQQAASLGVNNYIVKPFTPAALKEKIERVFRSTHMSAGKRVAIVQGEQLVIGVPGVIISTLLGSCVAVCLYDPIAKVGGMNHFLLPSPKAGQGPDKGSLQRYGIHSMEMLINEMMKKGASRLHLKAHLYGGANLFSGLGAIGTANGKFAREFMETEGIKIGHVDLGGTLPRKVEFQPYEGRVRSTAVSDVPKPAVKPLPVQVPDGGDVELF